MTSFSSPLAFLDRWVTARKDTHFVVLVWFLFCFPLIALRGFHYDEGLIVAIARGALQDGYWIEPHFYGMRFVERPNLPALVVAGLGALTGGFEPFVVRLPAVLALLLGALLIKNAVRDVASRMAGVFAALCFLVSPMVTAKIITAKPDMILAVLLFWAFMHWWRGERGGGNDWMRWLAVGLILAIAGLVKGPQPLGYFAFGVGAWLLWYRRWSQIPGFVLAGALAALPAVLWYLAVYQGGDEQEWARYMRVGPQPNIAAILWNKARYVVGIAVESIPAILLAAPGFVLLRGRPVDDRARRFATALLFYASFGTLVILLWPSQVSTRYAMPALPAIAVLAGLGFDELRRNRPRLVLTAATLGAALSIYPLAHSWIVAPLAPGHIRSTWNAAAAIDAVVRADPATLYVVHHAGAMALGANVLGHLDRPTRSLATPEELVGVATPAWILAAPKTLDDMARVRGDVAFVPYARPQWGGDSLVLLHMVER